MATLLWSADPFVANGLAPMFEQVCESNLVLIIYQDPVQTFWVRNPTVTFGTELAIRRSNCPEIRGEESSASEPNKRNNATCKHAT